MFEPRGHDVMSGSILYPPTRDDCDIGILFIEVSGCLPMCGHGTIGTVTWRSRTGWSRRRRRACSTSTRRPGASRRATSSRADSSTACASPTSPRYLPRPMSMIDVPGLGELDVRYRLWRQLLRHPRAAEELRRAGSDVGGRRAAAVSPIVRRPANEKIQPVHPEDETHPRRQPRHVDRQAARSRAPTPATPCSTATRRSTARLAAPAPRRAWPSSPARGR